MRFEQPDQPVEQTTILDLEPPAHLLEESRGQINEHDISLLFGKINQVAIQPPLISTYKEEVAPDIVDHFRQRWQQEPKFVVTSTTFGCLPDPDCQFVWIRVVFNLGSNLTDSGTFPVAYQMYPETSQDEVKKVRAFEVSSKLGITVEKIGTPSITKTRKQTDEHLVYNYMVTTYGKLSPKPAWDIRATEVHPEIAGDFTLILVIATNPDIEAKGTVSLSTEVQLRGGRIKIPLLMKQTHRDVIGNEFVLSNSNQTL